MPDTSVGRRLARYRDDPRGILQFVDEELKATPDPWQETALLACADSDPDKRRVSMQACAGPGKSTVLAWIANWFMLTQGDALEHPKGAAISISRDNLKDNLWAEIGKWKDRSTPLREQFTITAGRFHANDHPDSWFISARAYSATADPETQGKTLSGLHAKYVLVLIDESGAIPTTILRAAEQALTTCAWGKIAQAGNPISLEGCLYAAATVLRHQWVVIKITGDPADPKAWVHSPRVGDEPKKWAQLQIDTYGRDNPWVKGYILGEFPPSSINQLLSLEEVEAATNRVAKAETFEWVIRRLGVDAARFGDDRTVLFPRQGRQAFAPVVMRNADTSQIAGRVASSIVQWTKQGGAPVETFIDDTGHWGHGIYDQLNTASYNVQAIIYSAPAIDPRFRNRRMELWWQMADWVRTGGCLPKNRYLVAELTAPTYSFVQGKMILEDKALVKKRLGRSPDLADGLANTFGMPDAPFTILAAQRRAGRAIMTRGESEGRAMTDAPDELFDLYREE